MARRRAAARRLDVRQRCKKNVTNSDGRTGLAEETGVEDRLPLVDVDLVVVDTEPEFDCGNALAPPLAPFRPRRLFPAVQGGVNRAGSTAATNPSLITD